MLVIKLRDKMSCSDIRNRTNIADFIENILSPIESKSFLTRKAKTFATIASVYVVLFAVSLTHGPICPEKSVFCYQEGALVVARSDSPRARRQSTEFVSYKL